MENIDKIAVDFFLRTVKREINKGNWYLVPRNNIKYEGKIVNYKQALLDLGIVNKKQIVYYLTSLKTTDCFNISRDHDKRRDYNDDIYEFKVMIKGIETYIKLTLNDRGAVCISFHKSDSKRRDINEKILL